MVLALFYICYAAAITNSLRGYADAQGKNGIFELQKRIFVWLVLYLQWTLIWTSCLQEIKIITDKSCITQKSLCFYREIISSLMQSQQFVLSVCWIFYILKHMNRAFVYLTWGTASSHHLKTRGKLPAACPLCDRDKSDTPKISQHREFDKMGYLKVMRP